MWELDCEESWVPKNWCFWTVVLEKTLESPLDCKEIQPVLSKGDQSWVFFGRTDGKVETPVIWPPHVKSWLIGKDSDAGRDWGQEEKGMTEDEMTGWQHQLDGCESEWTHGVGDGQGGLACCNSWGRKESDTTERLNWTELTEDWRVILLQTRKPNGRPQRNSVSVFLFQHPNVLKVTLWPKMAAITSVCQETSKGREKRQNVGPSRWVIKEDSCKPHSILMFTFCLPPNCNRCWETVSFKWIIRALLLRK